MRVFKYLWTGKNVADLRKEIVAKLNCGEVPGDVYLISVPQSSANLLDIMKSSMLKIGYNRDSTDIIIGAAGSLEEAYALSGEILAMVNRRFGAPDIRRYLRLCEEELD